MKPNLKRLLLCLACVLPFLGWQLTGLMDLDEGFYGAVASEMNRRGEWIIPFYNGHPWYEKPIFLYWAVKPFLLAFGVWWGPRAPSVLAAIATMGLVAWFGNRRLKPDAGSWAAFALATSILFVAINRMVLVDPFFIAFITGTFVFFWESLVGDKRWRLAAAACLGLSVLAKGPVGCLFFVFCAGYVFWREEELRSAFRGLWMASTALFAAVVASWYWPATVRGGHEFVQKFLIEQNIGRLQGGDEAHKVPAPLGWLYYIPIVVIGMAPWWWPALKAIPKRGEAVDRQEQGPLRRYLVAWALAVLGLFSLSGSKLPHYALPAFPALALLAGWRLSKIRGGLGPRRAIGNVVVAVGMSLFVNCGFWFYYHYSGEAEAQSLTLFAQSQRPAATFVEYQMSGDHSKNFQGLKVNQTSLPSLVMYLDHDVSMIDDVADLLKLPSQSFILTRPGRLSDDDLAFLGRHGAYVQEVSTNEETGDSYILYWFYYGTKGNPPSVSPKLQE